VRPWFAGCIFHAGLRTCSLARRVCTPVGGACCPVSRTVRTQFPAEVGAWAVGGRRARTWWRSYLALEIRGGEAAGVLLSGGESVGAGLESGGADVGEKEVIVE
jgi:hypothetical protein